MELPGSCPPSGHLQKKESSSSTGCAVSLSPRPSGRINKRLSTLRHTASLPSCNWSVPVRDPIRPEKGQYLPSSFPADTQNLQFSLGHC